MKFLFTPQVSVSLSVLLLSCTYYYSIIHLVHLTLATIATVDAFVIPCHHHPHHVPSSTLSLSSQNHNPRIYTLTHLYAVADPPPKIPSSEEQEEESKKKKNKKINKSFFTNMFQKKSSSSSQSQNLSIITIENILDYKSQVVNEVDDIVVVRFYAEWCRSCKASEPNFWKLVSHYTNNNKNTNTNANNTKGVKFVQVPLNKQTAYLHEGLGVPSVPFAHIYHPDGGLVEELKLSRPHFSKFATVLESYVRGSCDVDSNVPPPPQQQQHNDDDNMDEDEGKDSNVWQ